MNHGLPLSTSKPQSTSLLPTAVGIASALFYVLFTLLPNSNSMMVKWPWVFIWQFGLILGPVAVLFQLWQHSFRKLGHRLDFIAGAWCIALILSASFAPFPHQAFWYGWAAICNIAFLYVLNSWLTTADRVHRLLTFQGILSVIFSAQSLISWYFQTVRPYQETIAELRTYGVERSFDLQILTLRNWHPIGHQNYVAGYLLLAIPLLVGLAVSARGWQKFAWLGGVALSLANLYSTASRGSWFGLMASLIVFIGFSAWQYPKSRKVLLSGGFVGLGAMLVWMLSSDRLRNLFSSLLNADPTSDIAYRLVTNTTGWNIGLDHPLCGAGLGSVTLLYQKYRPDWAGQTAELTYQLHSTPAQLWAELGIIGTLLTLASLFTLSYLGLRWAKKSVKDGSATTLSPIIIGIVSALTGYSIYAITDYQLDNICISGTLAIFTAILLFENRPPLTNHESLAGSLQKTNQSFSKRWTLVGSGLLVAVSLWLFPIHRAWMLSSQGFLALQQKDTASFVAYLEKAHQLAPWEPYYPYQLGWNLGELAFQSPDAQQQEMLRQDAVKWFEKANKLSPNREFGYSNLGWLQVNSNPQKATQNFLKATQLTPRKAGIFFALGYSLLREGKSTKAIQPIVRELMQKPVLLTSPIWQRPELSSFYPQVLIRYETELSQHLAQADAEVSTYVYQTLGSLYWWRGDLDRASQILSKVPTSFNKIMLKAAEVKPGVQVEEELNPNSKIGRLMTIWNFPSESRPLLSREVFNGSEAMKILDYSYINRFIKDIETSIETSDNFHEWLTSKVPEQNQRNQRWGFGTISRHIDGPLPTDFALQVRNTMAETFLTNDFFPKPDGHLS
ncbi:MAG: O-antigen ligase family protein [Phormidesmis sp.]